MLTDTLCTRCGLCCDGTLLGDVELTGPAEAARLELLGLDVDSDDADTELLSLPCAGLHGTTCRVYAHRPHSCRAFECRLLQLAQRGTVTVPDALARIAEARAQVQHVKALLSKMHARPVRLPLAEQVAEAIAAAAGSTPRAARVVAGLDAAMAALAHTIRATFLD
jgi:uncharacterized protein